MMLQEKTKKHTGEFYTPDTLAEAMAELLLQDFSPERDTPPRILDPSCGDGQLLEAVFHKLLQLYLPHREDEKSLKAEIVEKMLFGMDISREGIRKTRERLKSLGELGDGSKLHLASADFLLGAGKKTMKAGGFSHIIGNPPYIGHKNLELEYKKRLKEAFPEVYSDKTDILCCFFQKAADSLQPDGKMLFITSRYYIEAPTYKGLRRYLQSQLQIEKIIDFDSVHVFKEARVASCITCLKKMRKSSEGRPGQEEHLLEYYKVTKGGGPLDLNRADHARFPQAELRDEGWIFPDEGEKELLEKIRRKGGRKLSEMFESYQGIITGCDKAFVVKDQEETDGWNEAEKALLRPWIKNSHIMKFRIQEKGYQLIYADLIREESAYPHIMERLRFYRGKLEGRREVKKGFRAWFALQWGRNEEPFRYAKIVHPYKASENRFAIDRSGRYSSADVYSMVPKEGYEKYMEWVVAFLNTELYSRYFRLFGKKMGGAILDYYPNKVMEMVVCLPQDEEELARIQRLHDRCLEGTGEQMDNARAELEAEVHRILTKS